MKKPQEFEQWTLTLSVLILACALISAVEPTARSLSLTVIKTLFFVVSPEQRLLPATWGRLYRLSGLQLAAMGLLVPLAPQYLVPGQLLVLFASLYRSLWEVHPSLMSRLALVLTQGTLGFVLPTIWGARHLSSDLRRFERELEAQGFTDPGGIVARAEARSPSRALGRRLRELVAGSSPQAHAPARGPLSYRARTHTLQMTLGISGCRLQDCSPEQRRRLAAAMRDCLSRSMPPGSEPLRSLVFLHEGSVRVTGLYLSEVAPPAGIDLETRSILDAFADQPLDGRIEIGAALLDQQLPTQMEAAIALVYPPVLPSGTAEPPVLELLVQYWGAATPGSLSVRVWNERGQALEPQESTFVPELPPTMVAQGVAPPAQASQGLWRLVLPPMEASVGVLAVALVGEGLVDVSSIQHVPVLPREVSEEIMSLTDQGPYPELFAECFSGLGLDLYVVVGYLWDKAEERARGSAASPPPAGPGDGAQAQVRIPRLMRSPLHRPDQLTAFADPPSMEALLASIKEASRSTCR